MRPTIVPIVTAPKITTEPTAVAAPTVAAARNTGRIVRSGDAAAPNGTMIAATRPIPWPASGSA